MSFRVESESEIINSLTQAEKARLVSKLKSNLHSELRNRSRKEMKSIQSHKSVSHSIIKVKHINYSSSHAMNVLNPFGTAKLEATKKAQIEKLLKKDKKSKGKIIYKLKKRLVSKEQSKEAFKKNNLLLFKQKKCSDDIMDKTRNTLYERYLLSKCKRNS
jgi:hypothetical protein